MNRDLYVVLIGLLLFPSSISVMTSLNVDMAIILHCGQCQTAIKSLGSNLAKVFDFGDDKTRVALVAIDTDKFVELTGIQKDFDDAVNGLEETNLAEDLTGALKLARETVFKVDPSRPRVIFIISQGGKKPSSKIQREGKLLRDGDVLIYVLSQDNDDEMIATFEKLVGNPDNVHQVDSIDNELNVDLLKTIKTKLTRQFCKYELRCFFYDPDQKICRTKRIIPKMYDVFEADCTKMGVIAPSWKNESCAKWECEQECDDSWRPAMEPQKCLDKCGEIVAVDRGQKRWNELDTCPDGRPFRCSPCSEKTQGGKKTGSKTGSSIGLILGIVIPILVILVIIVVVVVVILWKRKKARRRLSGGPQCAACVYGKKTCDRCRQKQAHGRDDRTKPSDPQRTGQSRDEQRKPSDPRRSRDEPRKPNDPRGTAHGRDERRKPNDPRGTAHGRDERKPGDHRDWRKMERPPARSPPRKPWMEVIKH